MVALEVIWSQAMGFKIFEHRLSTASTNPENQVILSDYEKVEKEPSEVRTEIR